MHIRPPDACVQNLKTITQVIPEITKVVQKQDAEK